MSFFRMSGGTQPSGSVHAPLPEVPEAEIARLFSPASPVVEEALLAGRKAEMVRLVETLIEPGKHAILYGERGVGKTSLANMFWLRQRELPQFVVAARVQVDPSDDFSSLWRKALGELGNIDPASPAHSIQWEGQDCPLTPDAVRRYLQRFCLRSTILIIDEFDRLRDVGEAELMADTLKSLSDYGINCTVIIVGVAETPGDLIRNHGSLRRCLACIPVRRMQEEELSQSVSWRLERIGLEIETADMRKMLSVSRGLPFYVHKIAQSACLVALRKGSRRIGSEHVSEAIEAVVSDLESVFPESGPVRTPARGGIFAEVLLAAALAETDGEGYFSPASVVAPLSRILGRAMAPASFQRHLADLASDRRGCLLVRRGEPGAHRFRFRDALMQPFVIMRALCSGVIEDAELGVGRRDLRRQSDVEPADAHARQDDTDRNSEWILGAAQPDGQWR